MPITMLTAYDFATARMVGMAGATRAVGPVSPPGVDICLCGDSLAMANLGYSSTTELGLDELGYHLAAIRRGLDSLRREPFFRMPLLVADLPFGTFEASVEQGVQTAITLVRRARVDGVKIEGGAELVPLVERLASFGIPVVGHVGLTPQRAAALGGFRVQGHNSPAKARQIIADALCLERAGCVALVVEAVPTELVSQLLPQLSIPAIGIGAGPATDGQVLVFSDLVGGLDAPTAKFVPNFSASLKPSAQVYPAWELGLGMINEYVERVRSRRFPELGKHTYQMKPSVLKELNDNGW